MQILQLIFNILRPYFPNVPYNYTYYAASILWADYFQPLATVNMYADADGHNDTFTIILFCAGIWMNERMNERNYVSVCMQNIIIVIWNDWLFDKMTLDWLSDSQTFVNTMLL